MDSATVGRKWVNTRVAGSGVEKKAFIKMS